VDPLAVVTLVQRESNTYKLDGATLLRVNLPLENFETRLSFANELLDQLAPENRPNMAANA
jgi:hypothetical protein